MINDYGSFKHLASPIALAMALHVFVKLIVPLLWWLDGETCDQAMPIYLQSCAGLNNWWLASDSCCVHIDEMYSLHHGWLSGSRWAETVIKWPSLCFNELEFGGYIIIDFNTKIWHLLMVRYRYCILVSKIDWYLHRHTVDRSRRILLRHYR